jgi:transposase
MSTRFDLTDEEWALIAPLLPRGLRGPRRVEDWRALNGIFYVLRTGCPWRDVLERYCSHTTCYNRWARRGVWRTVFDRLTRRAHATACI